MSPLSAQTIVRISLLVALSLLVATAAGQREKYQEVGPAYGRSAEDASEQAQQQQQQHHHQQQQRLEGESEAGERVDKLASAAGDFYLDPRPLGLYSLALAKLQRRLEAAGPPEGPEYEIVASSPGEALHELMLSRAADIKHQPAGSNFHHFLPNELDAADDSSSARNYRALVDNFKHYSHLSNPSRQSRAFKPKLMSTARGFGKRSSGGARNSVMLADLLAASALPNGLETSNGKMSGNAVRLVA